MLGLAWVPVGPYGCSMGAKGSHGCSLWVPGVSMGVKSPYGCQRVPMGVPWMLWGPMGARGSHGCSMGARGPCEC